MKFINRVLFAKALQDELKKNFNYKKVQVSASEAETLYFIHFFKKGTIFQKYKDLNTDEEIEMYIFLDKFVKQYKRKLRYCRYKNYDSAGHQINLYLNSVEE